jgi:hypothetical protein
MPVLPQYDSQRNIDAQQPAPFRTGSDQGIKDVQGVLNTAEGIAQDWQNAQNVMQYTRAKSEYELGVTDVVTRASQDPDYMNSDKYYKELEDVKKRSLTGISDGSVLENLSMEMDYSNKMSAIKIDTDFRKKEIEDSRFKLSEAVESLQNKKLNSSTAAEAMQYDGDMQELLEANVSTGIITKAEAKEMREKANLSTAEYDAVVNPDLFLANDAKYYGIQRDEYSKLAKTANETKKRTEKEELEALDDMQQKKESELIMNLANKEIDRLSAPDIASMVARGEVSREFGEAYIKLLTSPKHIDKKKKIERSGFTKYAKELFKSDDPEQVRKALVNMLDGAAEGELNEEQLGVLLKVASQSDRNVFLGKVVDGLEWLATKGSGVSMPVAPMVYDFFKNILDGDDVEKARKKAIDDSQIRNNPDRTKYMIGDSVETPLGLMYVWDHFPDGSPKLAKEKPPENAK